LAHAAGDLAAGGHGFIGSKRRPDEFDEFHLRHRVEEMHPDATISRNGDVREIRDRKRRGIAYENGAGLGELVEDGEEFELHLQLFWDGFNDEIGVAYGVFDVACSR